MSDNAIYMEKRAFFFFRSFPDVPQDLRPVYSRFYDVGLIWADPNADDHEPGTFPGVLRWTEAGRRLREIYDENFPSGTVNFFSRETVMDLLPSGDLGDKERKIFVDHLPAGAQGVSVTGHPAHSPKGLLAATVGLDMAISDLLSAMSSNRVKLSK